MISLERLESSWPPLRGAVLLRTARESHGRVSQVRVAVCAGHVSLSLAVHAAGPAGGRGAATTTQALVYRVTVLLDAVPDSAPHPSPQQLARFLYKLLEFSEVGMEVDLNSGAFLHSPHPALVSSIPQMLVVENEDDVVSSEFIELEPKGKPGSSGSTIYACLEATGLLQLWSWRGESDSYSWTYLNCCSLCSAREDPLGARVLTASIGPEQGDPRQGSRYRIAWLQEDRGEGAGLGLGLGPEAKDRRRVWSRRITLALDSPAEEEEDHGDNDSSRNGLDVMKPPLHSQPEVFLGFSVSLLAESVDTLLCSNRGVWMVCGSRILFNSFATGRLLEGRVPLAPELELTGPQGDRAGQAGRGGGAYEGMLSLSGGKCHRDRTGVQLAKDDSANRGRVEGGDEWEEGIEPMSPPSPEPTMSTPLFAIHDTTKELMVFCPPRNVSTVSVVQGSLSTRSQCSLATPPPPGLSSFTVFLNFAIFAGFGLGSGSDRDGDSKDTSGSYGGFSGSHYSTGSKIGARGRATMDQSFLFVYDLCTGGLLGAARGPHCHCSRKKGGKQPATTGGQGPTEDNNGKAGKRGDSSLCGTWGRGGDENLWLWPKLWRSCTPGHRIGVLSPADVLRVVTPDPEACMDVIVSSSTPSGGTAPSIARLLRLTHEYHRLTGARGWEPALFNVLRSSQKLRSGATAALTSDQSGAGGGVDPGLVFHALAADAGFASAPPWLLLAVSGSGGSDWEGAGGSLWARAGAGAGLGAWEGSKGLIRKHVEESLHSLNHVRLLLQDSNTGSQREPQARAGAGGRGRGRTGGPVAEGKQDEKNKADALALATAGVDPATALFEETLRQWLEVDASLDGGVAMMGAWAQKRARAEQGWGLGAPWSSGGDRASSDGLSTHISDQLALAYLCEAADTVEDLPGDFLHILFGSEGATARGRGKGRGRRGEAGDPQAHRNLPNPDSDPNPTFDPLVLFLCSGAGRGEGVSQIFEVVCRALFRLDPCRLPRFVERLAHYRAYTWRMKSATITPNAVSTETTAAASTANCGAPPLTAPAPTGTFSKMPPVDSESSSIGTMREKEEAGHSKASSGMSMDGRNGTGDDDDHPALSSPGHQSIPSDPSKGGAAEVSARVMSTETRPGVTPGKTGPGVSAGEVYAHDNNTATECHPRATSPSSAKNTSAIPAPVTHLELHPPTLADLCGQALTCLPRPASDDGKPSARREARLSLMMGAGMHAEASRLLREKAWRGKGGKCEAEKAWAAAMRLLGSLQRAA
ncbi:unnamed protein product, partial [Discosporangium mesarthrocarpum]